MRERFCANPLSLGLTLAAFTAGLPGCSAPEPAPDFQSTDPTARLNAIRDAAASGDPRGVRGLISRLDSDDPAERLLSFRALERITGQTLGYDFAAPKTEREAAVARWVSWYASFSTAGVRSSAPGSPRGAAAARE